MKTSNTKLYTALFAGLLGVTLLILVVIIASREWVPQRFEAPPTLEEVMAALETEAEHSQVRADSLAALTENLRARLTRLQYYSAERLRISDGTRELLQTAVDSLDGYVRRQDSLASELALIIAELRDGRVLLLLDTLDLEQQVIEQQPD